MFEVTIVAQSGPSIRRASAILADYDALLNSSLTPSERKKVLKEGGNVEFATLNAAENFINHMVADDWAARLLPPADREVAVVSETESPSDEVAEDVAEMTQGEPAEDVARIAELLDESNAIRDLVTRLDGKTLKEILEVVEGETDDLLLEDTAKLMRERGVPSEVVAVVEDRVRVIRREQDDASENQLVATWSRSMTVLLTTEEKLQSGVEAANIAGNIHDLESEAKSSARRFKARLEMLHGDLEEALRKCREGHVLRTVEGRSVIDPVSGMVREIRNDTNEMVKLREQTTEERQQKLWDKVPTIDQPPEDIDEDEDSSETF